MEKVRIVTDSNAYLAPEFLAEYAVEVIPHRIKVGSSFYEEGNGFRSDDLFAKFQDAQLNGSPKQPAVQAADINTILDVYQQLGRESEQIVSIHMSSELSPMWTQARRAAEMLKGRYTIRVIDSMSTSFGMGLLVEKAAKAAHEGASVNEIARIVNGAVPHLYVTLFAESLGYLRHSAGLGPSQSLLGTMLGIKPMLMMEEGRLVPLEKVQTHEEVLEKLHEFVIEFANIEAVGIVQHRYDEVSEQLQQQLHEALPHVRVDSVNYPPSLAAYLGPSMIGVIVYEGAF
ncbi:MAG: DegV family protein [Caldilineaceae bacterium]|nr:DegV family protein [Caldilineaceae bacterium]